MPAALAYTRRLICSVLWVDMSRAARFQVLMFGIVPQVLPVIVGNVIFEWDVNIRRSTIMGLVGAGGLGLALHRQMASYNYGGIATVIFVILLLIVFGELFSAWARRKVI